MMEIFDLGQHAGFIWMAYGVSLVVLAALVCWIKLDARRQTALLAELEAKGIRRRSSPSKRGKRS